ncbi:something about silencing, SAS, complex subunit 4-domain-containing protein [Whalleya microplaca]|nr:something about silencing, SAS, complex subunit 4-domain-containing protein [Whalleya microplaca]
MATSTSSRRPEAAVRYNNQHSQHSQHSPLHHPRRATHANTNANNNNHNANANASASAANASANANVAAKQHAHIIATRNSHSHSHSQNLIHHHQSNSAAAARMKRPLDPIDNSYDSKKNKRTRITVEILARPISQSIPQSIAQPISPPTKPIALRPQQIPTQEPPTVASSPLSPPAPPPPRPPPTGAAAAATATATATAAAVARRQADKTAATTELNLTKHQEKVINGIKHELDRLQPSAVDTGAVQEQPGRKLRSQEATRFKSELSAYFPDYDEVIGNIPKEQHILNLDTPILVVDSSPGPPQNYHTTKTPLSSSAPAPTPAPAAPEPTQATLERNHPPHSPTVRTYGDNLFTELHDSQRVDFAFLEARYSGNDAEDPLQDSYFAPVHRKAERLEKSIRNTEKGRAQHEKDQIIRLLNELQGHDWLRTMGVSGVTESRKKTFEPARDHFIKGCQAILEKFRLWSQEEKKRKLEKERALAEQAEGDDDDDEGDDDEEEEEESDEAEDSEQLADEDDNADEDEEDEDEEMSNAAAAAAAVDEDSDAGNISDGDPPGYNSDVDASARQLHDEAMMARARYNAGSSSSSSKRSRGEPPPPPPHPHSHPSEQAHEFKEFSSFFEKRHQRDAALNKTRRRGRTVVAWGHPVPDTAEYDFDLPEDYRDSETLRAHERQKRRERRQFMHHKK